jgi:site-specific DNA-methyltransferase (adenine-specific)
MILEGDCFDLIKEQPDNSVDLIITSPPYADIVNYGKNISIKKPNEYVDWIIPLFKEIYRVLKPSGSFILNINDNCSNGLRNTFIYDLISRNNIETKLKLYDTYIWHKKNGIPNGAAKRFRNTTEFIFHFIKNKKDFKFYMDRALKEPTQGSKLRSNYEWSVSTHGKIIEGQRIKDKGADYSTILEKGARPDNVFRFSTAGASRDNHIKHPAPFHKDLPLYFINLLTDEGDIVLDVFAGIGTTGVACKELNRQFIGYELNPKYAEFGNKRISGDELETHRIVQYDLDGNYIADYKNRMEASRATGIPDCDIMRTYNRTKFDSRGGYIWKLINEKEIK